MLFKKNKSILPSFSDTLPAYVHSREFVKAGKAPLEDERKRLASLANHAAKDGSFAVHQLRDATIDAESREEINYGKQQFAEHMAEIQALVSKRNGELELALTEEALILAEIAEYEKELK